MAVRFIEEVDGKNWTESRERKTRRFATGIWEFFSLGIVEIFSIGVNVVDMENLPGMGAWNTQVTSASIDSPIFSQSDGKQVDASIHLSFPFRLPHDSIHNGTY